MQMQIIMQQTHTHATTIYTYYYSDMDVSKYEHTDMHIQHNNKTRSKPIEHIYISTSNCWVTNNTTHVNTLHRLRGLPGPAKRHFRVAPNTWRNTCFKAVLWRNHISVSVTIPKRSITLKEIWKRSLTQELWPGLLWGNLQRMLQRVAYKGFRRHLKRSRKRKLAWNLKGALQQEPGWNLKRIRRHGIWKGTLDTTLGGTLTGTCIRNKEPSTIVHGTLKEPQHNL